VTATCLSGPGVQALSMKLPASKRAGNPAASLAAMLRAQRAKR
jgi:hypothetical protein